MSPDERSQFLAEIGDRFRDAVDAGHCDDECVVVPLTQEECEAVLRCLDPEAGEVARMVRGIFQRVLRQMSSDNN